MAAALHELSVAEAGASLRDGRLSSEQLTANALARIETLDPALHAFVLVTAERALADARRADGELTSGVDRGPLHGIPYGLKDIFATAGVATTCHSKLMVDHVPAEDAGVVARLTAAGAVLLGKLATHEYALGGPSTDLPFPPARNPWNVNRVPGASSSGSGVAVAAGFARIALGSDTSGSIRGPACHCGVVGLKPTYGRVSRRGAFPLSWSLDHCGPLAWTVADAALALQAIAGHDPLDPGSAAVPVPDFSGRLGQSLDGLKIGYARDFFAGMETATTAVTAAVDKVAERLAILGATVEEVTLPDFELFNACGRVIMTAEAYAIHEQDLRRRPRDYGRYTYQRIVPGATLSAADLTQAHRLRRELAAAVDSRALGRCDALLTASGLGPAPRFDDFPPDWPPPSAATAMHTIPFNVTGHPALALPAGFFADGLPLGVQIVGRMFDEATVLQIGAAYEVNFGKTDQRPNEKGSLSVS